MKSKEFMRTQRLLKLNMQFFAEGGDAGTGDAGNGSDGGTGNQSDGDTKGDNKPNTADLDKIVQSRVDKLTAEMGKKNADLQKELDKLKKEKMTADELKQLEISEKEKALAEREKTIAEQTNRFTALKALKEAGLDDGSNMSLELVDFVMAENEDAINKRVKAFGDLVKKFVAAEVDKTFKKNGRNPNGGTTGGGEEKKESSNIAEKLGKARADKAKQSNDVLNYYLGGKK